MITIHEIGPYRLWTGATREIDEQGGCPQGWTRAVPPELGEGEYARFDGVQWRVMSGVDDDLRTARLYALAERRWRAETGGITVGGIAIRTDEDTQRKITGAYVQAVRDEDFEVRWKIAAGVFVTLDAAAIVTIGDAVTSHIQACFSHEAGLTAAILAAEDTAALAAIDIENGWPG